jgi:hypothetical protein
LNLFFRMRMAARIQRAMLPQDYVLKPDTTLPRRSARPDGSGSLEFAPKAVISAGGAVDKGAAIQEHRPMIKAPVNRSRRAPSGSPVSEVSALVTSHLLLGLGPACAGV